MRILLIGNYEPDQQESMQRFADILAQLLPRYGHEVRLIKPKPLFIRFILTSNSLKKWFGYLDKFLVFPFQLRRYLGWADIVHICDHSNAFYTKYLQSIPHLVTCNDLLAIKSALEEIPENPTGWTGKQLQKIILRGLQRSQRIACISQQTCVDLLRITGIPDKTASVVYMGLNYPYSPMSIAEVKEKSDKLSLSLNSPFLLHVGGNQWYKNRLGVLKIFLHLKKLLPNSSTLNLVLVGKALTSNLQNFISLNNLEAHVKSITGVGNEDLRALYSAATALLFPSLQEGFGWPIIEAQACGCPVITSNRPPMTEVGGEAALYIDPDHPKAAAQQIAVQFSTLESLKSKGLENVLRFSTTAMLQSYCQIYEEIVS